MHPWLFRCSNYAQAVLIYCFLGPAVTVFMEIYQSVKRSSMKSPPIERTNRRRHLCLVYILSIVSIGGYYCKRFEIRYIKLNIFLQFILGTYLANLYLAEGIMFRYNQFSIIWTRRSTLIFFEFLCQTDSCHKCRQTERKKNY